MDERRRLQGMAGPFPAQVTSRAAPQLRIDKGDEPATGIFVARVPGLQQGGHGLGRRR